MRIAVFGAGGTGGYFGARFAKAGADVTFIARGAHLAAIRHRGLAVRSVVGDFRVDARATDDPAEIGPVDVVMFAVKSYDTAAAAGQLLPLLRPATIEREATAVVSFQNGIDNEERIASTIGEEYVVGGVTYIFSTISEPGVIEHVGGAGNLIFGELDGQRTQRLEDLVEVCRASAVPAEITADIRLTLWTKYAFLCALAGMTASVRLPVGEIRTDPAARAMFRALLEEGRELAAREGVELGAAYSESQMGLLDSLEPVGYSSLHHDLTTGHRMELEALHGEFLRRALRARLDVPATRAVYAILSPWARRNETRPRAGGTPLRAG